MGFLDTIENLAGQQSQPGVASTTDQGKVAGGLMQALDEHPGGLQSVISSFQNNGMAEHVQNWSTGQQPTATPDQIHQGLNNTGLIDTVAQKAGVSPQVAEMAMATILPMVLAHFTQGGQTAPPQSGFGGMASQILGKLL